MSIPYSPELGAEICNVIASGKSTAYACRLFGIPESTVREWRARHPEFAADSLRARELGAEVLAEQCIDIADTPLEGVEVTENTGGMNPGTSTKRADMLGHRRLQIDTRLRLIGKWNQRYAEKTTHEVTGKDGGPLQALLGTLGKSTLPVVPEDPDTKA